MAVVETGGVNLDLPHDHHNWSSDVTSLEQQNTNNNNTTTNNTTANNSNNDNHKREMRELQEMLSKLNPSAQEFVPTSLLSNTNTNTNTNHSINPSTLFHPSFLPNFVSPFDDPSARFPPFVNHHNNFNHDFRKNKGNFNGQGKRRTNSRTGMAQRDEVIRRTVYVSDIDQQVTEEQLAGLFINYGQVVDCRICGDPNSVLRFAFVEFTDEDGAQAALNLSGTMLGFYPIKVLPSKTAIAPVNPTYLPQNDDEREMCARTVYCTNIDKKLAHADIKMFFENVCGEVQRLRMLGDNHHSTRIAFVEFVMAESAIAALNCSGVVLGATAIRVSPSKTPVRARAPKKLNN